MTLRIRSSDAHSGLDRFWYGVDEEAKRKSISASGTATITVTAPASGGRTWIYLWSEDNAGNDSNRAVFDFFAARYVEATPAAAWRLDGDGFDDSGQGHELHLGGGADWTDDAALPGASSLGFDTTGCVSTEGPVVRTDAEYTVTAWARLDSTAGPYVVMGAAGQRRPGFTLRYNRPEDRWVFVLGDHDEAGDPTWISLRSAQPPVPGQWTHLAVRVDPAARHMQMYVDAALVDEREIPWVTWNAGGPVYVGCAGPASGATWGHYAGAIHHAGVWQGLLTPDEIQAAYDGELAAGLTGDWRLQASGADSSPYARDVSVPGGAWVPDQYGRPASALRLDGTGWAEGTDAVVRTDQSFSVAGWAKLDNKDDFRTVISQGGVEVTRFNLNYHPTVDSWQLSISSGDDIDTTDWYRARSTSVPEIGPWYHLAGVYDRAANELRLYVDGELEGVRANLPAPWVAEGPLLIGTGGNLSGERSNRMVGTVSDVRTWRGALTDEQVAEVYGGNPAVASLARWHLDGHGNDPVGGHTLHTVGTEGVDYDWVADRFCFPWSALGLQLSGAGHAATSGPVVTTDESFTVAAWVKLDSVTGGYQTVLSQGGADRAGFYLQATPSDSWRFSMPQAGTGDTGWVGAESAAGTIEVGAWTYLVGVSDLGAGETRLYVNGELAATGDAVETPWHAGGPFYIGAAGTAGGAVSERVHGAIDMAEAWSSTVDPERIAVLGGPVGAPVPCL